MAPTFTFFNIRLIHVRLIKWHQRLSVINKKSFSRLKVFILLFFVIIARISHILGTHPIRNRSWTLGFVFSIMECSTNFQIRFSVFTPSSSKKVPFTYYIGRLRQPSNLMVKDADNIVNACRDYFFNIFSFFQKTNLSLHNVSKSNHI